MENKKNKNITLALVAIVVLVVIVTGVAFAAFNFDQIFPGSHTNTISRPSFSCVHTTGKAADALSLTNKLPMSAATGKAQTDYFEFTESATTTRAASTTFNYSLFVTFASANTLDKSNVYLYLTTVSGTTETAVSGFPKLASALTACTSAVCGTTSGFQLLANQSLAPNNSTASTKYRLRMWIKNDMDMDSGLSVTNATSGNAATHTLTMSSKTFTIDHVNSYCSMSS